MTETQKSNSELKTTSSWRENSIVAFETVHLQQMLDTEKLCVEVWAYKFYSWWHHTVVPASLQGIFQRDLKL